jgi:hypothetical protein
MSLAALSAPVEMRSKLSPAEFASDYLNRRPVVMRGAIADMPAVSRWSLEYFASLAPDEQVRLKAGSVSSGSIERMRLRDYADQVAAWERRTASQEDQGAPPAYLHDLPLLSLIPGLRKDLDRFPVEYLPSFFAPKWWLFTQFFVGPSGATTPLHFDSLLTHNFFMQVRGTKRFVMVDAADRALCYPYRWRWSPVDPDEPDLERFPEFRHARVLTCEVHAGDLLYMPPGTLHKVTSLNESVSFNIDWHDRRSAIRGLTAALDGMPWPNLRYNALFALGVIGRVPLGVLMPALRSYFFYVS